LLFYLLRTLLETPPPCANLCTLLAAQVLPSIGPLRGPAKEPERLPPGKTIHKALTLRLHGFDSFFSSDLRAEKPASSRIPVVQNAKRRCRSNLVFLRRILPEFFGRSLRAGGAGQCVVLTARFAESGRNARSESFVS